MSHPENPNTCDRQGFLGKMWRGGHEEYVIKTMHYAGGLFKNSCHSPIDLFYLGNSETIQGLTQLFKKQDGEITPLRLPWGCR
jgi:hypothetical protein